MRRQIDLLPIEVAKNFKTAKADSEMDDAVGVMVGQNRKNVQA